MSKKFTVIGIYEEDYQTFADQVEAESAKAASDMVVTSRRVDSNGDADNVIIAGVVAGHVEVW